MYCADAYPGIRQLILRETFPELKRSLISKSFTLFPGSCFQYNENDMTWYHLNGSIIEFGYLDSDDKVSIYKSAEYDIIRFDEASEFSEFRLTYMQSRLRGANDFPHQIKMSSNPDGIGHKYLKKTFKIGVQKPGETFTEFIGVDKDGKEKYETRCYIPALVYENEFLMKSDPDYITNLLKQPEKVRKSLLEGSWDIFDDQAFPEFDYNIHVCKPFPIPTHWKKWRSCDNGYTDPFAWYWHAVDEQGTVFTYREYTREEKDPKVTYSEQAKNVVELSENVVLVSGQEVRRPEKIQYTVVGHDAFNSHPLSEQGKSIIDYYNEGGLYGCVKAVTDRRLRKAVVHEYLKPYKDENTGRVTAKWIIFDTCKKLIQAMPELLLDPKDLEKYYDGDENSHVSDGCFYGLISYHAEKSKSLSSAKTETQKDMERLWKQNRGVSRRLS